MNLDVRDWFRGSLIVARRDLTANTKSIRVVVISLLTLLVMVGAALGISGLSPIGPSERNEFVLWPVVVYRGYNGTPATGVVWVSTALGEPRVSEDVALGQPGDLNEPFRVLATNVTNATGWVRFSGLTYGSYPLQLPARSDLTQGSLFVQPYPTVENFSFDARPFDILGDGAFRDWAVHVTRTDGRPAVGADVRLENLSRGTTDANGYFRVRLDPGSYNLTVVYDGETSPVQPIFVMEPGVTLPFYQGPDGVLLFLVSLMGLFGPIVAIAVSYDALAKERMQGSLELLLVRPASRTGLAVGKFLGTFASVALPMLAVVLGAIAGIVGITGKWPDPRFASLFVVGTMALLAMYVLIMQIFSTVAKSPGTAILSAIMVWLLFNVIWNIVFVAVSALLHVEGGTPAAFTLSALTLLFNPTGVFQLMVLAAAPASLFPGTGSSGSLPDWSGPVAAMVWIAVLLVLAVLLFKKKII